MLESKGRGLLPYGHCKGDISENFKGGTPEIEEEENNYHAQHSHVFCSGSRVDLHLLFTLSSKCAAVSG